MDKTNEPAEAETVTDEQFDELRDTAVHNEDQIMIRHCHWAINGGRISRRHVAAAINARSKGGR